MKTEIEAKFLDVNHEDLRRKLRELGAAMEQPMRLMRRAIIDDGKGVMQRRDAYVRVRDEGDKITLTYKQFDALSVDGAKEIEVTVSDYEATIQIFEVVGFKVLSRQESRRETWRLDEVEIVLDEWPWLKPYIEIEGDSEVELQNAAKRLGFDWQNAVFGDVMAAYRAEYPHLTITDSVVSLPEVSFDGPLPGLLQYK